MKGLPLARIASLDAVDLEILRIIAEDCTTPIKEISRRVGVSQPMVRKRIRRMKSWGLIKGCRAEVDPDVLGATSYIIIFESQRPEKLDDVLDKFSGVDKLYASTSRSIGVVVFRAENLQDIDSLVKALEDSGCKILKTALLDVEYGKTWIPEAPKERVQPKCAFCQKPIIGKPYIMELDDGTILLFNSKQCAEAYLLLRRGGSG